MLEISKPFCLGRYKYHQSADKRKNMIETKVFNLVGRNGRKAPIIAPTDIVFPSENISDFKSACGAGEGVGDWIVPERVLGLSVSPACFVHDTMWDKAEPTWEYFHFSNSVFLSNILSLIETQSSSSVLEHMRMYRAVTYFNAVDTVGAHIFWSKFKEAKNLPGV